MRPAAFPPRAVLNLLLAGFTLRWFGLERHSLALDEAVTWAGAVKPSLGGTVFADPGQPPAWRILTRIGVTLFGDAEESLRAPAALCGVAAVFLAWRLGLRLFSPAHAPARGGFLRGEDDGTGRRKAIWFTAFAALSTTFLEVSQEAGPYALLLVESLGLPLLYLRWLDRGERGAAFGLGALGALALHTHVAAAGPLVALLAHALFVAARTRRDPDPAQRVSPRPIVLAVLGAGLLSVPWFVHALGAWPGSTSSGPSGWHLLYLLRRLGAGPAIVLEPPWTWVTDLVWVPALLLGIWGLSALRRAGALVRCLLVGPLVVAAALPARCELWSALALVVIAPWLWLLAVVGAYALPRHARGALLAALGVLVGLGLVGYHVGAGALVPAGTGADLDGRTLAAELVPDPQDPTWFLHHGHPHAKVPWRDAQEFVRTYGRDDDLVVLHPPDLRPVWDYHDRRRRGGPLSVLALPVGAMTLEAPHVRGASVSWIPGSDPFRPNPYQGLFESHRRIFVLTTRMPPLSEQNLHAWFADAVDRIWQAQGSPPAERVPPVPFRHAQGLSISVISRPR